MKKLNNWNDWCNDKVVFTSITGQPIVFSPNAIFGFEQTADGSIVYCVDGITLDIQERAEEALAIIGEGVEESKVRQEKKRKEEEEKARKAYEDMQKAEKKKTSK